MLTFEMAQDILQPFLDPSQIAGMGIGGGGLQPLEQIGYALFEMGEGGCVVVADRYSVETIGQGPQRGAGVARPTQGHPGLRPGLEP